MHLGLIYMLGPYADLPDIGLPRVDGPPVMPEDPYAYVVAAFQSSPSPDYVPGPEYPPSPEFVLKPVYLEFMPLEDEILPAEEQPLPATVLPTTDSPGFVPESDPEEDPEEDDDEDPEEDPANYPIDGGDDGDNEDESSDDDEDEDADIEGDEEEVEHPAPADSTAVALPAVDQAPSAEETEPFETDEFAATPPPHPAYHVTARISIRDETPISLPPREEVERLLAMSTPPSSPLSPWSSPLPQIPSPPLPLILSPLPVSPPLPQISSPLLLVSMRAEAASTSHSLPLPPPIILSHTRPNAPSLGTPPLHLLSTNRRVDRHEVTLPPKKRLGIALGPRYEDIERCSVMDHRHLGLECWQETDEIYTRLRWMSSLSRQLMALGERSMDASDLARAEVMSLRTQVVAQQAKQFIEALKLLKILQTQMTEFERQQGPTKGLAQPDAPEEAVENQVKFATCTLHSVALTWWNTHVKTVGHDAAYVALKPKTYANAIENAKPSSWIRKSALSLNARQRVKGSLRTPQGTLRTNNNNNNRTRGRVLAGPTLHDLVRRSHTGDLNPYALNAIITMMVHVLLNAKNATKLAILPVTVGVRKIPIMLTTRRALGQVGGGNAPAKVYAVGHAGTNLDSNVMTGTFLLNNRYASVLFDTGADRSFVSTAFSSQIDITPTTLDHYYDVELDD
ncbi:reverse transcriptase domain-containing protein [Tanacetum coccineum]